MYDVKKQKCYPPHIKGKRGACLVLGSHPCVYEDRERAVEKYPRASICVVNDAADLFPADYLATVHPEKLPQFTRKQYGFQVHTRNKMKRPQTRENEYVWDLKIGGGSALFAVGVMLSLGYEQVIMCGCPMDGGGGYAVKNHEGSVEDPRLGDLDGNSEMVRGYHRHLKKFKEQCPDAFRVSSMSGKTMKIFGGIS